MTFMKDYFVRLFHYNKWANTLLLDSLASQKVSDDKILTLMGHILSAEFVWLSRILGGPVPPFPLWGTYVLPDLHSMAAESSEVWILELDSQDDFVREIHYTNTRGISYTSRKDQIMIHVVSHGTYHRGQIARMMREGGFEPVNTDYITYDRSR